MVTFTKDQIAEIADLTAHNHHGEARLTIAIYMNDQQFAEIYAGINRAHDTFGQHFGIGGIGGAALRLREALEVPFVTRMLNEISNSAAVKAAL